MQLYQSTLEAGYEKHKDVEFSRIESIYINNFRSLKDRTLKLGKNITLITGKNGTMKSTLLGLLAHPFSSPQNAKDHFGNPLKTTLSDVFRLSLQKDTDKYSYYLNFHTSSDEHISEIIRVYPMADLTRHRVVVGKDNKGGGGNFSLNTCFVNLKRLFPIIETEAQEDATLIFSEGERKAISKAYLKIMQRTAFDSIISVTDNKSKNTIGPVQAAYDFNSISSGEDNLGNILIKMLAFERNKSSNPAALQGIFCIDELEASLHPVSLIKLFDYLLEWSEKQNIQVVITTHSLYLIDHCLRKQLQHESFREKISLNMVSTRSVGDDCNYRILHNPTYKDAYKELTFNDIDAPSPYKVNIICEDKVAKRLISSIIKSKKILSHVDFITDVSGKDAGSGASCSALVSLAKNGVKLLDDSIIIVDSDVSNAQLQSVRNTSVSLFRIPDPECLAIEKRIVKFIATLDGADPFFKDKEKDNFISDFTDYNINPLDINATDNIRHYKNWASSNPLFLTSYITSYVKHNVDTFDTFRQALLGEINKRRESKSLPPLEYN